MQKNITKRFKKKAFNLALADANKLFSPKEERVKMLIKVTSGVLFLALLAGLAFASVLGAKEAFNNILITLVIDGAFFGFYQFFPRLWAFFYRWKYAAKIHNEMGGFDLPNIKVDVNKIVDMRSWVTLQITNNSRFPIKDCFIKIVDIKPAMITNLTEDVILEWADHFRGQSKIDIGINDGLQRHIANSVVASWIGNEQERKVFIFTTEEPYKEHKFVGVLQKYRIVLEIHGNYLWEEFTQKEIVEIEPMIGSSLLESSINIRLVEKDNAR